MKLGTRVRLTKDAKQSCHPESAQHMEEFGDCEGIVEGPVGGSGPEVNVRWEPSGLRYGYDPKHLIEVT